MSYESDRKHDKRFRIFWLSMVAITIILLGLKLCNICDLYNILCYKIVFLPLYGPVLIIAIGIVWAIIVAIVKVMFNNLFRNK